MSEVRTREQGIAAMMTATRRHPLRLLTQCLEELDAKPSLDDAERLARSVIIDVICQKSPAAEAAFQAWADSDDNDVRHASAAIIAGARS